MQLARILETQHTMVAVGGESGDVTDFLGIANAMYLSGYDIFGGVLSKRLNILNITPYTRELFRSSVRALTEAKLDGKGFPEKLTILSWKDLENEEVYVKISETFSPIPIILILDYRGRDEEDIEKHLSWVYRNLFKHDLRILVVLDRQILEEGRFRYDFDTSLLCSRNMRGNMIYETLDFVRTEDPALKFPEMPLRWEHPVRCLRYVG